MKFAIPEFRLDKKGYAAEIALLDNLGVEFRFNMALGRDISLDRLSTDFDAVVIAVGMGKSLTLEVIERSVPPENRFDALEFLQQYNNGTLKLKSAAKVLVIGGGNSALDSARAARRAERRR